MDPLAPIHHGGLRGAGVGAGSSRAEREIREVSEQFEAIFMRQVLRGLRKTAEVGGESSYTSGFYGELLDDQLAQHLARSGGMGLAGVIRAYLEGGRR